MDYLHAVTLAWIVYTWLDINAKRDAMSYLMEILFPREILCDTSREHKCKFKVINER